VSVRKSGIFPKPIRRLQSGDILAVINLKTGIVQVKIVYYGPGRGGKTTNLEYIYNTYQSKIQSKMISIKTDGDRTLFFDFLPFSMGKIRGYDIQIQLYTVPGQIKYNATRQLVLRGVDGIVFVADSSIDRQEKNRFSLENLQENLTTYHKTIDQLPFVLQYNKRDLKDEGQNILELEEMNQNLNGGLKAPFFPASALKGINVVQTLRKIITMTVSYLEQELN
jgi:hypothetical protein